ncbi:MAG: hypothetical protein JW993_20815 [Sedimentisphaerales bacterium]|nr:hypothetical protein [Sedimentisphaerales bacterium]
MKRKTMFVVCCTALVLTARAQALIPSPLPPIDIVFESVAPGQLDAVRVGGTWPDACRPIVVDVITGAGPTLWIDLTLSTVFEPDCDPEDCLAESTAWEVFRTLADPITPGVYDIYARAIDCNAVGKYELILRRFQVGSGGDGGGPIPGREFEPGQRVVLLQDEPVSGLRAGQSGTVVCCDRADCSGRILVSWDLWTSGKDDTIPCASLPVLAFPAGSAVWVDPTIVMTVGRPFNQCGTIRKGLEGCIFFEADDGKDYTVVSGGELYVELDTPGAIEFDQRLRLRGLLDTAIPPSDVIRICPVRDGDIYHPILSSCTPPQTGCCDGELFPGDRVTLLVDEPIGPDGLGALGLMAGTDGTVICCAGPYGANWVFISWDGWTDGINADAQCGMTVIPYVRNSGWWVPCNRISLGDGGNGGTGDGFVVRIGGNVLRLEHDQSAPNPAQTLVGCTTVTVESNFRALLSVEVTATSAADGTWTGTVTPEIIDPGTTVLEVCVRGENVDLIQVPPGANRQLASLSPFAEPAP